MKPDNLMEDQPGRWLVMDFGIAKPAGGERLTQTGGSMGTPKYMSPEQARAGELDGRSDFYSLGVVAYHCLVGRVPFEGDDALAVMYAHLHDPVPEPELASDEAKRIYSVVLGLLAKSAGDRIQNGAALRAALAGRIAPAGVTPPPDAAAGTAGSTVDVPAMAGTLATWMRGRPRRGWAGVGGGAVLLAAFSLVDGAAARCREAMPDASENDRTVVPPVLEPGSYRVTLRVEGDDGRDAEASHDFTVVEP